VAPTFDLSAFRNGLEVIVPQPLTIRVPITGYPTPTAKWTFGDKELTSDDERVTMVTKSTFVELVVTPSLRPDQGTYSLALENDVISVSGEIEVTVIGTVHSPLLLHQTFEPSSKAILQWNDDSMFFPSLPQRPQGPEGS
jgi:titin